MLSMAAQVNAQAVRDFWQLVDNLSMLIHPRWSKEAASDVAFFGGSWWIALANRRSPRSSLSTEVRMEVLRFTDSTIVQRVHDYMIKLLKADARPENYTDKQSWFLAVPRYTVCQRDLPLTSFNNCEQNAGRGLVGSNMPWQDTAGGKRHMIRRFPGILGGMPVLSVINKQLG